MGVDEADQQLALLGVQRPAQGVPGVGELVQSGEIAGDPGGFIVLVVKLAEIEVADNVSIHIGFPPYK